MKEKKILKVLEVVELILTMIAIILLILLFRFEVTNLRFIFLFMNFYLIYSFSKILANFEKRIQIEKKKCLEKILKFLINLLTMNKKTSIVKS